MDFNPGDVANWAKSKLGGKSESVAPDTEDVTQPGDEEEVEEGGVGAQITVQVEALTALVEEVGDEEELSDEQKAKLVEAVSALQDIAGEDAHGEVEDEEEAEIEEEVTE